MEGGPLASWSRSPGRESTQRLCTCFFFFSLIFSCQVDYSDTPESRRILSFAWYATYSSKTYIIFLLISQSLSFCIVHKSHIFQQTRKQIKHIFFFLDLCTPGGISSPSSSTCLTPYSSWPGTLHLFSYFSLYSATIAPVCDLFVNMLQPQEEVQPCLRSPRHPPLHLALAVLVGTKVNT